MLTASQIARMRATMNRALPDIAIIQRRTGASDGAGGVTYTWAPHATVACRVSPIAGGEMLLSDRNSSSGDRAVDETTHVVTVAAETDITEADRVIVSGMTYEVTTVRARGEWELSRRVDVKEVP